MYTSDEIQAAVSKLVQTTVQAPTDPLGSTQTDVTFSDLQEAAAGVFVLQFDAPFYIAYLAAQRVREQVLAAQQTIDQLLEESQILNRYTVPIQDISALGNASAALQALNDAVTARQQGFDDINKVPAFRRYVQNLTSFLDAYGPNIKRVGDIVPTPQQAQLDLPGLLAQLQNQMQELVRAINLLANALEDFSALRLPQLVAGSILTNAQSVLDGYIQDLGGKAPEKRLEGLRGIVLDLLTQQTVVQQYGAALAPSRYLNLLGHLTPYSDATHLATPARLPATLPGPYITLDGQDTVEIAMDGGDYQDFVLPHGVVAELDGTQQEPFTISAGVNDELTGRVEGTSLAVGFGGTLAAGSLTAAQVAASIPGTFPHVEPYLYPTKLDSLFSIAPVDATYAQFTLTAGTFQPAQFNIKTGDLVLVLDGPNAGTSWNITALLANGFNAVGTSAPVGATASHVQIGAAQQALRISLPDKTQALTERLGIAILSGTDPVLQATPATLGFFPEMRVRSRPMLARDFQTYAKNLYKSPALGVARLVRLRGFGRSSLAASANAQYFTGSMVGDVEGSVPLQITITNFSLVMGELPAVGYRIILRSGPDIGQEFTVTEVSDASIVAAGPTSSTSTGIPFDLAPQLEVDFGWYLRVLDGPNADDYAIVDPPGSSLIPNQATPERLTLNLATPLPVYRNGPDIVTFTLELAQEVPVFTSVVKTVASEVKIRAGVMAELLFGPIPP